MFFSIERMAYSIPMTYQSLRYLDRGRFGRMLRDQPEGLYLRVLHSMGRPECFRIVPLDENGAVCDYTAEDVTMTAGGVELRHGDGRLYLTFEDPDVISVAGRGLGVRFDMQPKAYEYVARYEESRVLVNTSASMTQFMLSALKGTLRVDAPYDEECCKYIHCDFLPDAQGEMQMVSEQFEKVWKPREYVGSAMESMRRNEADFRRFMEGFPEPAEQYAAAMEEACFILWTAIVPPLRYVTRRGILCSNNWMLGVWTWDSAIVSMGTSLGDFDLAYDQLVFPFDTQTEEGLLPDYVNPNEQMWNFTKPPVHGIAFREFFRDRVSDAQLDELRQKFARQVSYFENYTDSDGDGIYQYNHGNDCGWDNCTPFEVGAPVEGPDLNSYLILEMRALSDICERLGRHDEAQMWQDKSDALLQRLIRHSWDGERFRVYQSGTHAESPRGDSLYPFMPLCLGRLLPKEIYDRMISELKQPGRFLTENGLATESISSDCYAPDGYWRGPIWAPTMLLLVMGIADGGDEEFARLLARRFCDMVVRSGFAENYNALTGEPLRDPAYTWTASAFLVMLNRYV